jgi:DNA-binding response OmpR family regulator
MADKKAVILIVEDEADINEAYQIVLKSAGYDVISAANGEEALKITKKIEPNLILLDLRMPQKDGIEFLREFDAQKHPAVKVIIFSNYDMQEEIQGAAPISILKIRISPLASEPKMVKTKIVK